MNDLHEITVMGREFRIRSESGREHLEAVARFVDERIQQVSTGQRHVAVQNLLLLTAMNLADELFRMREREDRLRDSIRQSSQALLARMGHAS